MNGTLAHPSLHATPPRFCQGFLFGVALCFLLLFSGCGNEDKREEAGPDKPVYAWGAVSGRTITIRGNAADLRRPYMLRAFERYQTLTGNTVHLEEFTHEELNGNLKAAFITGEAEKPDVLLSFGGTNIEKLNPQANFYDFTDAPWVNDLTDTTLSQAIYNGRVYGLPYWEASIAGMLYNKEVFRAYGVDVPQTQEDFFKACELLRRNGITPVYLPYAEPTMLLYQFPMDNIVRDARVLDALNGGSLRYQDIPGMKKVVSWYRTMAEQGYFGQNYEKNGWDGMDRAMRSGNYAMMLCWDTWLYTDFTGDPSKFGLMPAFVGVPEAGVFEGPNMALLLVNKQSPEVEAALDLISFIADPYNYNVTLRGMYTAPSFKNQSTSMSTPQYVEVERQIEQAFHDSTAWLRIRGFSQSDAVYIQKHMQDVNYGVEDCLKDMDAARVRRAGLYAK